ncbi:ribosome biogenesis protein SLX9 homolog isoform X4 [Eubalaena glacialis]|uniref:ribosome biogenesis protein SLX9 homolog isoform X4 n=1 Tax=Eubalaena glacialis TaxID=27606 RepID=UPI002A5A7A74|nr:ribosome biogenesis protein SLX9 homolog isoform X4 [Eubalaena glacialis]
MGKVRGLRSRVHKAAVRPTGEAAPGPAPPAREAASLQASAGGVGGKEWAFMNASVFAGTTIDPSALVQKLDVDARSIASVRRGAKAKAVLPKKEKLKLRRERWLQKIEATRLAEQKRTAARRRRATVVVGDLQPLRDALPELLELQTAGQRSSQLTAGTYVCVLTQVCSCEIRGTVCKSILTSHADRKSGVPKTTLRAAIRSRAAQLSRMSAAQRFQLLEEERTRFRELLASPAYRASPLQAIGRQLAQQMRLEGGGQC